MTACFLQNLSSLNGFKFSVLALGLLGEDVMNLGPVPVHSTGLGVCALSVHALGIGLGLGGWALPGPCGWARQYSPRSQLWPVLAVYIFLKCILFR